MTFPPTSPPLARALADRNYNDPMPVQRAVLEEDALGRDLLVSAQTGSGKTVAYGLAMASDLLGDANVLPQAGRPMALVVAPTRELALQVQRELEWLYENTHARVISCVGGMDPRREARALEGGAHIVVGTPGRLRDHLERGRLQVGDLKALVLDEADEMLDLGFREDLEFIIEATPQERRTLLFSATLPKEIVTLAKRYQRDAFRIQTKGSEQSHADIEYRAIRVAPREVEHVVVNVLRFVEATSTIVFCNTRESVRHLQAVLLERGFSVVSLSGELSQSERNHALQALRDGRVRVCVATDVAARGIDLPNLGLVIHAELPHDAEVLQHRSGRTGRAGRKGISVLLVPNSAQRKADRMMATARIKPSWGSAPSADEIRKLDQERLLLSSALTEESSDDDLVMARELLEQCSAETIATALVRMYRAQLPAPEDIFEPAYFDRSSDRSPDRKQRDRGSDDDRAQRPPRPARDEDQGTRKAYATRGERVWFHLNIGRDKNADPKWLLPMICRQGGVNRQQIGAIRIFEKETKFEIDKAIATEFLASVKSVEAGDTRFTLLAEAPDRNEMTAPPRSEAPRHEAPRHKEHAPAPRREERTHAPSSRRDERGPSAGQDRKADKKPYDKKDPNKKFGKKPEWTPKPRANFTPEPDFAPDSKPKSAEGKPHGKGNDKNKKFAGKPNGGKPDGKPFAKFGGKPKHAGKPGKKFGGKPKPKS